LTTNKKELKSIDIDKSGSEPGKLDYLVLDNKIDADLFIYRIIVTTTPESVKDENSLDFLLI